MFNSYSDDDLFPLQTPLERSEISIKQRVEKIGKKMLNIINNLCQGINSILSSQRVYVCFTSLFAVQELGFEKKNIKVVYLENQSRLQKPWL